MKKVFIDGSAGTTGLRIYERLSARDDVKILTLSEENRKDVSARKQMLNDADVAFLCLPDDAAREAVRGGQPTNAVSEKPQNRNVPQSLSREDLSVRIAEAQDLWRTRVDVSRAQWKERLKLSGESEKAFDAALQEMNERLYDSIAAVADHVAGMETMTPELGLRLVGETTAIMAEAYDRIGACVPQEMRSDVSSIQMVDFVDPGVAEPLIGVQGKLDGFPRPGGRRR